MFVCLIYLQECVNMEAAVQGKLVSSTQQKKKKKVYVLALVLLLCAAGRCPLKPLRESIAERHLELSFLSPATNASGHLQ